MLAIADKTDPFSFTEIDPLVASARQTIEAVARRFHPEAPTAWAEFTVPEMLLLTERVSRELRREALRHIPGVRDMRLSHVLWVSGNRERYGDVTQTVWSVGYGLWRVVRAVLNPIAAVGQEVSGCSATRSSSALCIVCAPT